ncbi:unnamed protein product [Nippostrongylus brasiliensis]|uniref:Uncharacterized protein n=1 Tax=Nippostrongylus brasiliensis TaxID=27835 RepID=A0A0N4Y8Y1_NIPBR|nr:unnamed protein product [Nippostrongylus brasiliensis]
MIDELSKELRGINSIPKIFSSLFSSFFFYEIILPQIRSVIIASEGPAFSSGHDLRELVS